MIVKKYFSNNVILIKTKLFKDIRGSFTEIYNKNAFKKIGIFENFVQDNYSISKNKKTIRGLHFQSGQKKQSKLVRVMKGSIFDVVVDLRKNSNSYGKYMSFNLKQNDGQLLYISKNFAHGFCTLENDTEIFYKVSNFYSNKNEKTILWNDNFLKINWPLKKITPTLSLKDKNGIGFLKL